MWVPSAQRIADDGLRCHESKPFGRGTMGESLNAHGPSIRGASATPMSDAPARAYSKNMRKPLGVRTRAASFVLRCTASGGNTKPVFLKLVSDSPAARSIDVLLCTAL